MGSPSQWATLMGGAFTVFTWLAPEEWLTPELRSGLATVALVVFFVGLFGWIVSSIHKHHTNRQEASHGPIAQIDIPAREQPVEAASSRATTSTQIKRPPYPDVSFSLYDMGGLVVEVERLNYKRITGFRLYVESLRLQEGSEFVETDESVDFRDYELLGRRNLPHRDDGSTYFEFLEVVGDPPTALELAVSRGFYNKRPRITTYGTWQVVFRYQWDGQEPRRETLRFYWDRTEPPHRA